MSGWEVDAPDFEDEFDQDLCLNLWNDFKKLLWKDELNPRVRCAFGNVYICNFVFCSNVICKLYLHSKLPIYTVNCQFFALNLKKFTLVKKNLHGYIRGIHDKYEVCDWAIARCGAGDLSCAFMYF